MKRLSIIIISFLSIAATAQTNIDVGTKWTYTHNDFGYYIPTYIEVVGDTMIDGVRWYILEGVGGCASGYKDYLIREDDSKVFMLDPDTNIENILYDYSKTTGESWEIPIDEFVTYVINVDSVGTIVIDGVEYNVQYIDNIEFGYRIIEGIGCSKYFFPQGNICDPHYGGIRCFTSDSLDIDFDPNYECDATYFPTSTSEAFQTVEVNIYPNPTSSTLTIMNTHDLSIQRIEVCTLDGSVKKALNISSEKERYEVNIIDLTSGIYLIKIISNGTELVEKIIKL